MRVRLIFAIVAVSLACGLLPAEPSKSGLPIASPPTVSLAPMPRPMPFVLFQEEKPPKPPARPRGLKATPKAVIMRLQLDKPFRPAKTLALPTSVAYVPKKLSMWLNDTYGVCVTSEEALNQAAAGTFIEDAAVYAFARRNGWLNGAYLTEVMDEMQKTGFQQGGKSYGTGDYLAVDFADENVLKRALTLAPVKIGIDADALPSSAGNRQGWYAMDGRVHQYREENHCVSLNGYGSAQTLYSALNVALPAGVKPDDQGYLLFTWGTIGFVDHKWIMSTTAEAFVRNPTATVNKQPVPNPGPGPDPLPPVPPTPNPPVPPTPATGDIKIDLAAKNITAPAGWTLNGGAMPPTPGATSPAVDIVKNHAAKKQARKDGAGLIVSRAELAEARAKIDAAVSDATVEAMLREKAGVAIGGPFTDFLEWLTTHQAELEALIALILKLVALFGI